MKPGTKKGALFYREVLIKAGLPWNAPFMRAVIAGMLLLSGMIGDAKTSCRKGHAREGGTAAITKRLRDSIVAAGWMAPSDSVIYCAIGDAISGGSRSDIERALYAAVAMSGLGSGGRIAPGRIAEMAAGYLKNGIPAVTERAQVEPGKESVKRIVSPVAKRLWETLLPMVVDGRLEDFRDLLAAKRNGIGRNGIGDMLLWCAATVPGRVPENESCPFCMELMRMGAGVRRVSDDGLEAHQLASGRTAALMLIAKDYRRG